MWCTSNTITVFQFQEETGQFQGDEIVSAQEQSKAVTFFKVVNKLWVLNAGSTQIIACFFFFIVCAWPNLSFSQKRWMMYTHSLGPCFWACSGLAMGTMYPLQSSYSA